MTKNKGTIALDIDGTITNREGKVHEDVIQFLEELQVQGWRIVFVTGREFSYAMEALFKFNFPYYIAAQNGADVIQMPEKKLLKSFHLSMQIVKDVEEVYDKYPEDFLLYAGFEKEDICFYRPEKFSEDRVKEILALRNEEHALWRPVKDFDHLGQDHFSMIKGVGFEKEFAVLKGELLKKHPLEITVIKDPISRYYDLCLITHERASKGKVLEYMLEELDFIKPLIVAGDDHNDESSLLVADIAVVMEGANAHITSLAHVIAPKAHQNGIIQGLGDAIKKLSK